MLVPDNLKAIVSKADRLSPEINHVFLEYAQARGFHVDPARVRTPTDKARCERAVRDVATFADPVRAQAAVDRFRGNAYDFVIDGESYRDRQKPTLRRGRRGGHKDAD